MKHTDDVVNSMKVSLEVDGESVELEKDVMDALYTEFSEEYVRNDLIQVGREDGRVFLVFEYGGSDGIRAVGERESVGEVLCLVDDGFETEPNRVDCDAFMKGVHRGIRME